MSNGRSIAFEQRTADRRTSSQNLDFALFQQSLIRRLRNSGLRGSERRKALVLCREVYRAVHRRPGMSLASAVADAACGAVREGLRPHAAFRVTGVALSILGLDVPVGVGRSLKQFILDGA